MSTQSISESIRSQAKQIIDTAKSLYKFNIHPEESFVKIELGKATASALTEQCAGVDELARPEIEALVKKAQEKLGFAEKVRQYIIECENNTTVDPRVEKLIAKLTQRTANPLPTVVSTAEISKIFNWGKKIARIAGDGYNVITGEALVKACALVRQCDLQLLQKSVQCTLFGDSSLNEEFAQFYKELPNPKESQKMASAYFAMYYLGIFTAVADMRTENVNLREGDPDSHVKMAEYIQKKQPASQISIEDLIQTFYSQNLIAIPLAETPLSYAPHANEEEIKKKLEALIALKNTHQLQSMGAFIQIGPQTIAIVFYPTGRISFYDPCGYEQLWKSPSSYEVNCGNTALAAEFLKKLTNAILPNQPITFKPYCDKVAFEHAKDPDKGKMGGHPSVSALPPSKYATERGFGLPHSQRGPQINGKSIEEIEKLFERLASHPEYTAPGDSVPPRSLAHLRSEIAKANSAPEEEVVEHIKTPEEFLEKSSPIAYALHRAIEGMSQGDKGVSQALPHLANLKKLKFRPDSKPSVLDRVYFHLDRILNKETPDKIDRNDRNFGRTAFQKDGFSTLYQKLRAVQRVQVEVLLELLPTDAGVSLLKVLEQLKLDQNDLPKGQKSAADALYAKYTQIHLKEREKNPSLTNPNELRFGGMFGKLAFWNGLIDLNKVSGSDLRPQAVAEVLQDFNTAWSI